MTWPYPSTHPPIHEIIHPPMGGEVSTDFKYLNRIEIFRLVQVLLNFDWFWRSPPGGLGLGGWGLGWWQGPPHMCTCTHMHTCTHMYDIIGNPRDFPKSNGGSHFMELSCLPCMHVCAWVCVCACMCMCVGAPPTTLHPQPPSQTTPRAAGSPKHQNSISLELIEIIRFCLKILYLWTFLNSYRL